MILCGINHKTALIEIREKFHLSVIERELLLSDLKNDPAVLEAIVLSTCNRTEIYAHVIDDDTEVLLRALFKVKNAALTPEFKKHFYAYQGQEALRHFLRVATGADSLIFGEKQILGQIKEAVELSRRKGMMQKKFNILSNVVIRAGKKARTETQISYGGSSISWAAVAMAQNFLGSFQGKSVLIIGAGKMGYLSANYLKEKEIGHIYVMSRTLDHATALASSLGGTAVAFWELRDILEKVDVCICSANAPHYLVEKELTEQVMEARRQRQLLLIDISMPRNISPDIASLKNVSLLSIDDLDKALEDNINKRRAAIGEVEQIIERKIAEFYGKLQKNQEITNSPSNKIMAV